MPSTATATKFAPLLSTKKATECAARSRRRGMPPLRSAQAPSASPPAPLAGTSEPTRRAPTSRARSVVRHVIRAQKTGLNMQDVGEAGAAHSSTHGEREPLGLRAASAARAPRPAPGRATRSARRSASSAATWIARRSSFAVDGSSGSGYGRGGCTRPGWRDTVADHATGAMTPVRPALAQSSAASSVRRRSPAAGRRSARTRRRRRGRRRARGPASSGTPSAGPPGEHDVRAERAAHDALERLERPAPTIATSFTAREVEVERLQQVRERGRVLRGDGVRAGAARPAPPPRSGARRSARRAAAARTRRAEAPDGIGASSSSLRRATSCLVVVGGGEEAAALARRRSASRIVSASSRAAANQRSSNVNSYSVRYASSRYA